MKEFERSVSIVIPVYNEEANIQPLATDLIGALDRLGHRWEVIFVDDGSSDSTRDRLQAVLPIFNGAASIIELQRNFGQTAAMQAGIDQARGEYIVTMDGDLQNDPADIPVMLNRLIDEDLDLLAGWRRQRQDDFLSRKLPSRLANRLIGRLSGVYLNDYGCSLKVYRGDLIRSFRLYGEMHRFIPALAAIYTQPRRIREQPVNHRPRQHGNSKYGLSRIWRVLLDLLSVYFFMTFRSRPAHFFGRIGIALLVPGGLILAYLFYLKVALQQDIGGRPLLLTGVLLVIMALQFFSTGILGEYMTRIYYESTGSRSFRIRERSSVFADGWFTGDRDEYQRMNGIQR